MADRIEELAPRVRLAKIARATARHGGFAGLRIVVSRYENHRCHDTLRRELIPQINPGHSGQLNVQYKAIKPRPLHVRMEIFSRCIRNRLHPRGTHESNE